MKSQNSIVFLVPGFPEDEKDTTCIPALQLYVKHFNSVNQYLNIIVIAFQYPYKKKVYFWNGIKVYSAGGKGKGKILRVITWIRVIIYFIKEKGKNNVAGIHSFWLTECSLLGQIVSKLFNLPHITTIMGQDVKKSNKYLRHLNFSNITITSVSKFASDIFEKSINWKVNAIIPFGIENTKDNSTTNQNRSIDIIGVGSLIALKNYNLFINIISELVQDFPSLKVILIGDGDQRSEIEKTIVKKNLSTNILLPGKIPRDEVLHYMMQSKIFLHTSAYESQGLVFLEALYCGLFVVSFDIGYIPNSKKISLCRDKNEMVNEIKHLLCSEKKYEPEVFLTIEDTAKKFNELYLKLGIA